jgi:hypothetical protein
LFHPDFLHSGLDFLYSTLSHYELPLFILAALFDFPDLGLNLLMQILKALLRQLSLSHPLGLLALLQRLQIHPVRLKLLFRLFSFELLPTDKGFLLLLTFSF